MGRWTVLAMLQITFFSDIRWCSTTDDSIVLSLIDIFFLFPPRIVVLILILIIYSVVDVLQLALDQSDDYIPYLSFVPNRTAGCVVVLVERVNR